MTFRRVIYLGAATERLERKKMRQNQEINIIYVGVYYSFCSDKHTDF